MCGIIGVTGTGPAVPRLIDSLKRLEYRGYDSAGPVPVTPMMPHMLLLPENLVSVLCARTGYGLGPPRSWAPV